MINILCFVHVLPLFVALSKDALTTDPFYACSVNGCLEVPRNHGTYHPPPAPQG